MHTMTEIAYPIKQLQSAMRERVCVEERGRNQLERELEGEGKLKGENTTKRIKEIGERQNGMRKIFGKKDK